MQDGTYKLSGCDPHYVFLKVSAWGEHDVTNQLNNIEKNKMISCVVCSELKDELEPRFIVVKDDEVESLSR